MKNLLKFIFPWLWSEVKYFSAPLTFGFRYEKAHFGNSWRLNIHLDYPDTHELFFCQGGDKEFSFSFGNPYCLQGLVPGNFKSLILLGFRPKNKGSYYYSLFYICEQDSLVTQNLPLTPAFYWVKTCPDTNFPVLVVQLGESIYSTHAQFSNRLASSYCELVSYCLKD